jgi:hypothetical protein
MKRLGAIVAVVFVLSVRIVPLASALPRFSLQKGQGCVLCHVNPSGGGQRNVYGADVFGARELPAKTGRTVDAQLSKTFRAGGDYRNQVYFYNDTLVESSSRAYGFFTMQADLYVTAQIGDVVSLTYSHDVLRGSPEVFGMKTYRNGEVYVKAGSFLPNIGLRHDDHTAVTRGGSVRLASPPDGLIWKPKYADAGIEAEVRGAVPGRWTVGVFNGGGINSLGPDDRADNAKAILARGEFYGKLGGARGLLGANAYLNKSLDFDGDFIIAGGFAGLGTEAWTVMAEADYVTNYLPSAADPNNGATTLAFYSEATWRMTRGVYVVGRVEHFDPDLDITSGRVFRVTGGFEVMPSPGVEFKPSVRYQTDSRSSDTGEALPKNLEVLVQSHWWF